ncbi:MAG TPA: SH3 domain-containing protein [Gammaproteobacteria bacterium]|nr:SH3 domain-containing protein [Gammaproteobacteria bacterium]
MNASPKKLFTIFLLASLALLIFLLKNSQPTITTLFPIDHYSQDINKWVTPPGCDLSKNLLDLKIQQKHFNLFKAKYFGKYSPWNAHYINAILNTENHSIKLIEQRLLQRFWGKGYGENYRHYTNDWIKSIAQNINFEQLNSSKYQKKNRAITLDNLHIRLLPTNEVLFFNPQTAGQGYPFDNLQMFNAWAGTPLYILGQTRNHAWSLVVTPDIIGWVQTNKIAFISENFIQKWIKVAEKNLVAITRSDLTILDKNKQFQFFGYIGAVFPAEKTANGFNILIPKINNNQATIAYSFISNQDAVKMPITATRFNFKQVINALLGRPYGWGGIYFYNDCSAELKSLFTPFGIWLPRHSAEQIHAGRIVDLSANSSKKRLSYLLKQGHPLLSLGYVGGHIFLYIGNFINPDTHESIAMSYQNIWALRPISTKTRAIIGKSVFLPLLLQYSEDKKLASLINKSAFLVSNLDEEPRDSQLQAINLAALMGF